MICQLDVRLEWNDVEINGCEESECSVGERNCGVQFRLLVLGAPLDGAVGQDGLEGAADVLEQAVLVRRRLDPAWKK